MKLNNLKNMTKNCSSDTINKYNRINNDEHIFNHEIETDNLLHTIVRQTLITGALLLFVFKFEIIKYWWQINYCNYSIFAYQ